MAAANVTNTTPWTQFYCNKDSKCEPGFECHVNKYCIPQLKDGETCVDEKDVVAPFIARVDNLYHLYCDMPNEFKAQNVTCPLGCEKWEACHSNVCMLKKCTEDQNLCKAGKVDPTVTPTPPVPQPNNVTGNSSSDNSNVGAIAGGVSAAVVVLLAAGAFFFVRRRRAAKAAKTAAAAQALPTYASQDEKNAMSQVA
ncbi:hypothetical protein BGZ96_012382 [Linnemannia gamsii]|uniref:Uncharacterized protein n=1 Tax=Linnemannia gamsii TaxID=64522 RepID=A0ABQ7JQH9_9FUNG|nr:hypothetical protein BGZ96_012382 [Linnemannia gamsii]